MQGIKKMDSSVMKNPSYLQSVLSVGFDVVDFGSFVSSSIPQMKDTNDININMICQILIQNYWRLLQMREEL